MEIINYLFRFFKGVDKEEYEEAKELITNSNRRAVQVFSILAMAMLVALFIASFFDDDMEAVRFAYLSLVVAMAVFYIVNHFDTGKSHKVVETSVFLFMIAVFAFGIALSLGSSKEQMSVTIMALLFVVPLIFTEKPRRVNILLVMTIIAFLFIDKGYKTEDVFLKDVVNACSYGFLSIFVSSYLMHVKIRSFYFEALNERLVHLDTLTGIYNRYSYENDLEAAGENFSGRNLTLIAMDVNRLKYVNDNLGHLVGDELLKGAGSCIEKAFGELGKCYRIGGDEFAAIIENYNATEEELKQRLIAVTSEWKGETLTELAISVGIVNNKIDQIENVEELVNKADAKMYACKYAFYEKAGFDRRMKKPGSPDSHN